MRRPRILVIGAGGQVGRELVHELALREETVETVASSRSHADLALRVDLGLTETIDRVVDEVRPDHLLLVAAATNVRRCEENPNDSWNVNVLGTAATARAARRAGATLTFVSTDYVFDGRGGPYGEAGRPDPLNVYGAHKLAAERAIVAEDPRHLVIRTCQVFGDDPRRQNYVLKVADAVRNGDRIEAATDLFGTPTYAPDLARALVELTLSGATGLWHFAGIEYLSRHDLARRVAAACGCDPRVVVEVNADQMHDPVNRPRRAGLRNDRLAEAARAWTTPLDAALRVLVGQDRAA